MKKTLSLFLFFYSLLFFSQKTISGKIKSDDGTFLPSASVTIEEIGKNAILAYSISDTNGNYKVTFTSTDSKILVKVKAFNHKTTINEYNNATQTLNFELERQATEIKEVKLKTKLITKRGDTISYDLKSFESKSDRVLADVLKKIPGVEVNKDGSILYQGEPINKFYVNGKDLMEGSYGTINNSLPKDAVQKVEVMENHQPVKILQDKLISQNAAINVKLKNKITMTGRGEVGSGFIDPWLWNVKLTPMLFTQKLQWVLNYKTNNMGESVEAENNILSFGNRFEGMRRNVSQDSWLGVENASTPNIPEKRYLFNNVHYFSANLLTNLSKEWEFKANTSFSNNNIDRESLVETVYANDAPSFAGQKLTNKIVNKLYKNQAKGEIIFTKNAKKGFFKNTTTYNGFWNDDRAMVRRDEIDAQKNIVNRNADEGNNSPTGSIQNSLSTIIPWKEKLVNVMSYINYKKDKQSLLSTPATYSQDNFDTNYNYDFLNQKIDITSADINHSASVGFSAKKWTFTPEIGVNLSYNKMNSELFGGINNSFSTFGNDYINNLKWNKTNPYTQLMVNYKGEGINFNLVLPVNNYTISYEDFIMPTKNKKINKTTFEPSLYAVYDFASFWKASVFAGINNNFGDFGSLYSGYILLNPNFLNQKDVNVLSQVLSKNIGGRIEYRNPLNNLFFNVRYNYAITTNNVINTTQYTSISTTINTIDEYKNSPIFSSASAEIGKYFPKFKTNASVSFTNRDSNSFQRIIQFNSANADLVESINNTKSATFKFNNTYFSWLSLDYNIGLNWNESSTSLNNITTNSSNWSHNLSAFIYPKTNHTIGFYWDQNNVKNRDISYSNPFYDLSYQYTWAKKKIDFELKWINIANTKVFQRVTENPNNRSTQISSINIRPSQVMFTVKFNFK